jgi:hypothetical protein
MALPSLGIKTLNVCKIYPREQFLKGQGAQWIYKLIKVHTRVNLVARDVNLIF